MVALMVFAIIFTVLTIGVALLTLFAAGMASAPGTRNVSGLWWPTWAMGLLALLFWLCWAAEHF